MSADNFYAVKYDMKRAGWIVRMGFASDDLPVFASGDEELFPTKDQAEQEAFLRDVRDPAEYGVGLEEYPYERICYEEEYREYATNLISHHQRNLEILDEWSEA